MLCLVADAPHGDRKRPRRNAHFIGASSAHASNYQGSARGSVHLDDDVTHEAAACGRSPRCLLAAARGVEQPKKTFARIQPSLVSCEANDGEGDLYLVLTTTVDVTLLLAHALARRAMNRRHWR